jgi:DNA-binding NtrC family response regulator
MDHPRVVIMAGGGSVQSAVQAMKEGALDYLIKPFKHEDLVHLVRKVAAGNARVPESGGQPERAFAVGRSAVWLSLLDRARRVAPLPSTVLLRGETGTGKDVLARYIVSFGSRSSRPFVALNCAALPDNLVESELFGHARGAFTGAAVARRGLFEEADTGTLLLDEVGALTLAVQAKLLRFLEDRQVRRLGDNRSVPVDVRIIAATNLDMESAVSRHEFREDLYYRLNVLSLTIPPLRERPEDVEPLATYFLSLFQAEGVPQRRFTPEAIRLLRGYPFPGNIRELRHAVEQAFAFCDSGELGPDDFAFLKARIDRVHKPAEEAPETPAAVTPEKLREALEKAGGSRVDAAHLLKISRSTLYRLLRQLPAEE